MRSLPLENEHLVAEKKDYPLFCTASFLTDRNNSDAFKFFK